MYVKPDTVSYTSNIDPGKGVFHKPHVKKTSAELKCMICNIKFDSVYDMREHVKYPCQRSSAVNELKLDKGVNSEIDTASKGHIKIRRLEEDDTVGSNTPLSVLAEASKHVESLAQVIPASEEVIEELPEVDEAIIETSSDRFTVNSSILTETTSPDTQQTVVFAYPR